MSVGDIATAPEPPPLDAVQPRPLEAWERPLDQTSSWPVGRLASWSLMLLLVAGLYAPSVAGETPGIDWVLLLTAALLGAIGARALFEALGFATDARGRLGHAVAAVPPALLATGLMIAAGTIDHRGRLPLMGVFTVGCSTVTLATAGIFRGLEMRRRRGFRRVYFAGSADRLAEFRRELIRHDDRVLVGVTSPIPGPESFELRSLVTRACTADATVLVLDDETLAVLGPAGLGSESAAPDVRICGLIAYYEQEFKKVPLAATSQAVAVPNSRTASRPTYVAVRRGVEVCIAVVLLILTAPLTALAAAAVKLTSRGPVLYRQRRVGKGGVPFTLLKLRTMTHRGEADTNGDGSAAWAPTEAHRLTPAGRQLRRFRIDELPQLWNVLRGDLALIGPRPEQVRIVERLARELPQYDARHCIRPGMTGWAQVTLGYGASTEAARAKLQRDLYYIKHSSLRLDALIVWLTLKAVLAGRG